MEKACLLEQLSPYVREVGLQRHDSWRTKPRRIYDHEFLYCLLGTAHVCLGGREYRLAPGDLCIVPPDTPHTLWSDGGEPWEIYWFHCDLFFYEDRTWIYGIYNTPEKYARLFGEALPGREHIRANPVFEGGMRLPECVTFKDAMDVEFLFRSLFRLYCRQDPDFPILSKAMALQVISAVFTAGGWLNDNNYYRKLTVAEICACSDYNPDYAGKIFKREVGQSIMSYLNRVRVERAKMLFFDADLTLSDIAEMTGFSSENYFFTVVRKLEGTTPTRMRQRLLSIIEQTEKSI
ncbi:MAG: AraC family transcriptional regulator [Clostridia bacterium]